MASYPYVESRLTGIQDPPSGPLIQNILKSVFQHLMLDIRFGNATPRAKATNMSGGFFSGKTPGTANQEFVVAHNFGRIPYLYIPVLPLDQVGASIVRTTVSRAADASNIYLKSPDVSQTIFFYLEG